MITIGKLGIVRRDGKDILALRQEVFERDQFRCQFCGNGVLWHTGHLAHKKSRGSGGSDTAENTRVLCARCHHDEHNPKSVPAKDDHAI